MSRNMAQQDNVGNQSKIKIFFNRIIAIADLTLVNISFFAYIISITLAQYGGVILPILSLINSSLIIMVISGIRSLTMQRLSTNDEDFFENLGIIGSFISLSNFFVSSIIITPIFCLHAQSVRPLLITANNAIFNLTLVIGNAITNIGTSGLGLLGLTASPTIGFAVGILIPIIMIKASTVIIDAIVNVVMSAYHHLNQAPVKVAGLIEYGRTNHSTDSDSELSNDSRISKEPEPAAASTSSSGVRETVRHSQPPAVTTTQPTKHGQVMAVMTTPRFPS